jgi:heme exporter protein C
MRKVFYPAVLGWIFMGIWIAQIKFRLKKLNDKSLEN